MPPDATVAMPQDRTLAQDVLLLQITQYTTLKMLILAPLTAYQDIMETMQLIYAWPVLRPAKLVPQLPTVKAAKVSMELDITLMEPVALYFVLLECTAWLATTLVSLVSRAAWPASEEVQANAIIALNMEALLTTKYMEQQSVVKTAQTDSIKITLAINAFFVVPLASPAITQQHSA